MPIRQVFESAFAIEEGLIHGCEWLDRGQEVIIVVHQLEFDRPREGGVARQLYRSLGLVAACFDQNLEAQPLEPLRHRAPVPPKGLRRRLHVEAVETEAIEHGCIAGRLRQNLRRASAI